MDTDLHGFMQGAESMGQSAKYNAMRHALCLEVYQRLSACIVRLSSRRSLRPIAEFGLINSLFDLDILVKKKGRVISPAFLYKTVISLHALSSMPL
jgi:hypothetical protein